MSVADRAGYQLVQIRPAGYVHADAVTDLADSVFYALKRLGVAVRRDGETRAEDRQIVFGAHLIGMSPDATPASSADLAIAPGAIVYNTEQVTDESLWLSGGYMRLLRSHPVWDYSERNVARLRTLGVEDIRHVPVGFVPELTRVAAVAEDIDVLFYGSVNARRQSVLEELVRRGLKVVHLFGKYGIERDAVIARAKVVLSMHFYESKILEIVRVSYLLNNFKAVIAECGADTEVDPELRDAIVGVPYEGLIDACVALVADDAARRRLGQRAFRVFSARRLETTLAATLELAWNPVPPPVALPTTLHIGSGKDFRSDHFNVDVNPAWNPDAVLDMSSPSLVGSRVSTSRFGPVEIPEGYFETIIANDVLEHIGDLTVAMTNCLRLLRPGGVFQISVPYDLGLGAWQDPTHLRAFNENSWLYYTDWHWYLGWMEARFDRVSLEFQLSTFGIELARAPKALDEILRTPRAVDSMRVGLRKRYLQEPERRAAAARQPGATEGHARG
jgi:hypothetical protein